MDLCVPIAYKLLVPKEKFLFEFVVGRKGETEISEPLFQTMRGGKEGMRGEV